MSGSLKLDVEHLRLKSNRVLTTSRHDKVVGIGKLGSHILDFENVAFDVEAEIRRCKGSWKFHVESVAVWGLGDVMVRHAA